MKRTYFIKALAEELHDFFCKKNHMDQCSWGWEKSDPDPWTRHAHQDWYKKAEKVAEVYENKSFNLSEIITFIKILNLHKNDFCLY